MNPTVVPTSVCLHPRARGNSDARIQLAHLKTATLREFKTCQSLYCFHKEHEANKIVP